MKKPYNYEFCRCARLAEKRTVVAYGASIGSPIATKIQIVHTAGGQVMQTSKLVGVWKLESNAGKQPAEDNIKTKLIKFKADGTFVEATETLGPCPGLVPGRTYRFKGEWKLDENILEMTSPKELSPLKVSPKDRSPNTQISQWSPSMTIPLKSLHTNTIER
jgi:hypothetical protein